MMIYSELLLEKIDAVDIESMSKMLNEYDSKIEELKIAINKK